MKVLIADDEYHVIQAIRLLVPWEDLGVDTLLPASCGQQALDLIDTELPELVITDIVMEDKSGMDIMRHIASKHPSIRVIAISGHNDFEYVREMLTRGCTDYLLKPLEAEPLIHTIEKAIQSWQDAHKATIHQKQLQEAVTVLSQHYRSSQLSRIYRKMEHRQDWQKLWQELQQSDPRLSAVKSCKILYFHTGYFVTKHNGFLALYQYFEKRLEKYLEEKNAMFLSLSEDPAEKVILLLISAETTAASIIRLAQSCFYQKPFPFHIGISSELSFPEQLSTAFLQARRSFYSVCADHASSLIAVDAKAASITEQPAPESARLQDLNAQIFSALLTDKPESLPLAVTTWMDFLIPDRDIRLHQIAFALTELQAQLNLWMAELQQRNEGFSWNPQSEMLDYQRMLDDTFLFSRPKMQTCILSLLSDLRSTLKQTSSNHDRMHQIAQYMELNYQKPFVQSEYANLFYMNKDYMSRKFSATFGVNMLSYLNTIRIRHAKELLKDTNLTVRDIAFEIGFKDEKYFAKQFKKETGMTPKDYRES